LSNIADIVARNPVISGYDLVGIDGNAFSVIGYVRDAMKRSKWNHSDIGLIVDQMMSSDYSNLLNVASQIIYSSNDHDDDDHDDDDYDDDDYDDNYDDDDDEINF